MSAEKDWETPYLSMPHWPTMLFEGREGSPISRTRELLSRLGNPHLSLPPTVQVAGTNGKGSTIAFLRAMLEAAGLKVHTYTSPHLHRFNERIVLAGREIDETTLFTAIEAARMAAGAMQVSFFEGTTAAAFYAFSKTPADILLIETGCGGRFDPTNVIENPALSIITTVSYDHMDILGHTLEEIAWHKAGILKKETPCVIGFQPPQVSEVMDAEINTTGALPFQYGAHWRIQPTPEGMRFITAEGAADFPAPCLPGPHQYVNAGCAIAAATILDFPITQGHVAEGLKNARWPARLERIVSGPRAALLPPIWELWVDGAHNMGGAHTLAAHIEQSWHDKPTYLIFGTTQGKDVSAMFEPLSSLARAGMLVPVISEPKSYSAETLMQLLAQSGMDLAPADSIEDAIESLTKRHAPGRILVFGSLYLRVLVA